jgi:hypothetical protein
MSSWSKTMKQDVYRNPTSPCSRVVASTGAAVAVAWQGHLAVAVSMSVLGLIAETIVALAYAPAVVAYVRTRRTPGTRH